VELAG
jgi:tubulin polyglutamylase TTLL1